MSAEILKSLSPVAKITPEIVDDALSKWKKPVSDNKLSHLDFGKKSKHAKVICFIYTLISTPNFMEYIKNTKPFTSAEDLQFGPELCGQDIFDKYLHDTNFASRFICMINQIKDTDKKYPPFLLSLVEEDNNLVSVPQFLRAMIQFIDNANCWPYLPLPQKIPPFLFTNPLRQLFCSKRLEGVEPFLHLYTLTKGKSLQTLLLECDPLLDAPSAICFAIDDISSTEYKLNSSELPLSLGLPLAVTKNVFEQTCERICSWQKSKANDGQKEKVINAYCEAIVLETYRLSGYVAYDSNENFTIVLSNNQTKFKTKNGTDGDAFVLSAVYSKVE